MCNRFALCNFFCSVTLYDLVFGVQAAEFLGLPVRFLSGLGV